MPGATKHIQRAVYDMHIHTIWRLLPENNNNKKTRTIAIITTVSAAADNDGTGKVESIFAYFKGINACHKPTNTGTAIDIFHDIILNSYMLVFVLKEIIYTVLYKCRLSGYVVLIIAVQ